MIFKLHIPAPPLDQFIESIVYYSGYHPPHSKEKLLPDGYIDIIIDLTEIPKNVYNNEDHSQRVAYRRGWVSGFRKDFITIDAGEDATMMVIRFKPGGALPFFDFPMNRITGQIIELDQVWGSEFLSIRETLLEAKTPAKRLSILEQYLFEKTKGKLALHGCIDYAVKSITSASDSISIRKLNEKIGYSHKHFIHLFEKYIGVTPKAYTRIMKFQKVLITIENQQQVNWSQIALDCDYYDQAHFINEFKRFSGMNPSVYLTEKGQYLNYIPID